MRGEAAGQGQREGGNEMRSEVRAGGRGRARGVVCRRKWHARGGRRALTQGLWGPQGTCGPAEAHREHRAHARDLGRIKAAERLVEHFGALPSRREGVRCGARWRAGREADERGLVAAQAVCTGEGLTRGLGVRARAERTWNMRSMPVTLEVSKLLSGWLNADASCRVERGAHAMCGPGWLWEGGSRVCVGRRQRKQHAHGEGPTQGLCGGRARARSAPGTCGSCS